MSTRPRRRGPPALRRAALLLLLASLATATSGSWCRRRVPVRPQPPAPLRIEKAVFAADRPAFDNPSRPICVSWKFNVSGKDSEKLTYEFQAVGSNEPSLRDGSRVDRVGAIGIYLNPPLADAAGGPREVKCLFKVFLEGAGAPLEVHTLTLPAAFPPQTPGELFPTPVCPRPD